MKFGRLEIYELVTEDDYALTKTFEDVRVALVNIDGRALDANGGVLATLSTFDDEPVRIDSTGIQIKGQLREPTPQTTDGYGYWILRP